MNLPTTRFVFDRKHTATKERAALVQLEILFERKRKFISTGVKVYKDQWTNKNRVVNRPDMLSLNQRLDSIKGKVDRYINGLIERGETFSFETFSRWHDADEDRGKSFLEWMADTLNERADLRDTTKRVQREVIADLQQFGEIVYFSDLTTEKVARFDLFLRRRGLRQTTVWTRHKTLKTYIRLALRFELIEKDPYLNFKIERGKTEWGKFLTEDELAQMESASLPTESLRNVRDLFLLQCYTGLSFSDLMAFDFSKVRENAKGQHVYTEERKKTGVTFTVVLLPQALSVLSIHGYTLPKMSNEQYNMRLKIVADACGIDKPVSSHYGRRTCGMVLLNKGVPVEIVAKVLGHTNIRTTQQAYARILDASVEREFERSFGV